MCARPMQLLLHSREEKPKPFFPSSLGLPVTAEPMFWVVHLEVATGFTPKGGPQGFSKQELERAESVRR